MLSHDQIQIIASYFICSPCMDVFAPSPQPTL